MEVIPGRNSLIQGKQDLVVSTRTDLATAMASYIFSTLYNLLQRVHATLLNESFNIFPKVPSQKNLFGLGRPREYVNSPNICCPSSRAPGGRSGKQQPLENDSTQGYSLVAVPLTYYAMFSCIPSQRERKEKRNWILEAIIILIQLI